MTAAVTFLQVQVPGVGVVHAQVAWAPQAGSWSGDETLSNLPGHREHFSLLDKAHPMSVTGRVIRRATLALRAPGTLLPPRPLALRGNPR